MFWDDLTIGYLAGLIDGEGHLKVSKTQVQLSVVSTDYDIVERALMLSGIGTIQGPYQYDKNRKPNWRWTVSNRKDLARLLCAISPLLSVRRREKVMEVADYLHSRVNRPKNCAQCGELYRPSHWRGAVVRSKYCSSYCVDRAFKDRRTTCPVPE